MKRTDSSWRVPRRAKDGTRIRSRLIPCEEGWVVVHWVGTLAKVESSGVLAADIEYADVVVACL